MEEGWVHVLNLFGGVCILDLEGNPKGQPVFGLEGLFKKGLNGGSDRSKDNSQVVVRVGCWLKFGIYYMSLQRRLWGN